MDTFNPVCGGGVVWGCLQCPGCSDPQNNTVTNMIIFLTSLELLLLNIGDKDYLIESSKKIWNWLKQAEEDVAGLVDYVNGIVYDQFKPVISDIYPDDYYYNSYDNSNGQKTYRCCMGGCIDEQTGNIGYKYCDDNVSRLCIIFRYHTSSMINYTIIPKIIPMINC